MASRYGDSKCRSNFHSSYRYKEMNHFHCKKCEFGMPNLPNYREFFRSFTDFEIAAELATGLIPIYDPDTRHSLSSLFSIGHPATRVSGVCNQLLYSINRLRKEGAKGKYSSIIAFGYTSCYVIKMLTILGLCHLTSSL